MNVFALKWRMDLSKNDFEKLMKMVSIDKQKRINRFKRYKDAQMCLLGEVLTRIMISRLFQINNSEIEFCVGEKGKPRLKKPYEHVKINYSHSGDWIVCAISSEEVGIDVEQVKEIDMDIAKRFFSSDEYEFLMSLSGRDQLEKFFDIWTLKESYVKWDGKGLSISLKSFGFKFESEEDILFKSEIENRGPKFKQFFLEKGYKLSLCSSKKITIKGINVIEIDEILQI